MSASHSITPTCPGKPHKKHAKTFTWVCPQCGNRFAGRANQVYCNRTCRRIAEAARSGVGRSSSLICGHCGAPVTQKRRGRGRMYCSDECRKKAVYSYQCEAKSFSCECCGAVITAERHASKRRHCSPECRWSLGNKARCDRMNAAYVEHVSIKFLLKRDGGICQLCLKPVDSAAKHPEPLAPTIDHVIPLVKGGSHSKANCQLAHSRCNLSKGTKLLEERPET